MKKPRGYDDVKVGGGYTPPEVGGHHMVIHQVEESRNRNGGEMVIIYFDFAPNDRQKGLFAEQYKNDTKKDRKWPRGGRNYINIYDSEGNCTKSFKSFCTAFENSNGKKVQWSEDNFVSQFKGGRIGGVFGNVENEWKGKKSMRAELRWFCEDSKADDVAVPDPVYLDKGQAEKFMSIPDSVENEELPFN